MKAFPRFLQLHNAKLTKSSHVAELTDLRWKEGNVALVAIVYSLTLISCIMKQLPRQAHRCNNWSCGWVREMEKQND